MVFQIREAFGAVDTKALLGSLLVADVHCFCANSMEFLRRHSRQFTGNGVRAAVCDGHDEA